MYKQQTVNTGSYTVKSDVKSIFVANGSNNTTINFPDPVRFKNRKISITRFSSSDVGNITISTILGTSIIESPFSNVLSTSFTLTPSMSYIEFTSDGIGWHITNEVNKEVTLITVNNLTSSVTTYTNIPEFIVPCIAGKRYKIDVIASFSTNTTTTGIKVGYYSSSAGGVINGFIEASVNHTAVATGLKAPMYTIATTPTTGSEFISTGVTVINTPQYLLATLIFNCTVSGNIQFAMASEVAATNATLNANSVLIYKIL